MKVSYILALPAVAAMLVGCTDTAKLASQIEGSWSGAPERMVITDAASASMTPVYTFTLGEDNEKGGDVTVTAMLSGVLPINAKPDSILIPFQVTVSAVATINGTWKAKDDDEIDLDLNPNTLMVNVNPDNVTTADDALTDQTLQLFEHNRAAMSQQVQQMFTNAMSMRFMAMRHLDDVKINNNVLEYKMADRTLYMHRDGLQGM